MSSVLRKMFCNLRLRRLRVVRPAVLAAYLVLASVFVVAVFLRVERQNGGNGGDGGNGLPWDTEQGEGAQLLAMFRAHSRCSSKFFCVTAHSLLRLRVVAVQ